MPSMQSANVATYDFGAPVTEDVVLKFRVRELQGGKLDFLFENTSERDLEVTVQVSADDSSWSDTSEVANLTVPAKARSDAKTILMRQDKDKYVRIQAVGGTRGRVQIRPDSLLDIVRI